jgi:hypothetical protein
VGAVWTAWGRSTTITAAAVALAAAIVVAWPLLRVRTETT